MPLTAAIWTRPFPSKECGKISRQDMGEFPMRNTVNCSELNASRSEHLLRTFAIFVKKASCIEKMLAPTPLPNVFFATPLQFTKLMLHVPAKSMQTIETMNGPTQQSS